MSEVRVKGGELEIRPGKGLDPVKVQPTHTPRTSQQGRKQLGSSTYRVETNLVLDPAPSLTAKWS